LLRFVFVIAGFLSITGIIPIIIEEGGMHNSPNEIKIHNFSIIIYPQIFNTNVTIDR
jgi:hypothetical protein